jgi:outer membrane protein assembly factor BamA
LRLLKKHFTKISLFILIALIIVACNTTKRVPNGKRLLTKAEIAVDDKVISDEDVFNQLYQKPNSSILGYRLRLNLYNIAKPNSYKSYNDWLQRKPNTHQFLTSLLSEKQVNRLGESFLVSGLSKFLIKTGEAPVLIDSNSTKKSLRRLQAYYFNRGFFDVKTSVTKDTSLAKRINLSYDIKLGKPFLIDSVKTKITTPALDSLYQLKKANSFLKQNKQYSTEDFDNERNRITQDFRNNGAYLFQQNYISYNIDTLNTNKKVNTEILIKDYSYRENDTAKTAPFKLYKINKVNIYTDHQPNKNEIKIKDSTTYNNYTFYSEDKLKYKPRAITNAVFLTQGNLYSDENNSLTTKYLSNLKVFNYPTIQYKTDPKDENGLIANIFLTPRKKYTFNASVDFLHSNIQDFGISGNTSLGIRNVFNRAESFEVGIRGNLGASKDLANPNNAFFNISEIGIDTKLSFPRIFFFFNTDKIIPKSMIPSTTVSAGFAKQTNIGLDKQNFTSSFTYNWNPNKNVSIKYDLFNIQFVKNVNVGNYFNIYQSSYQILNELASKYSFSSNVNTDGTLHIESGTNAFIDDVLNANTNNYSAQDVKTVRSLVERKNRLSENNLIFASSVNYYRTTQKNVQDNRFYSFRTKVESAGNLLSLLASTSKKLDTQTQAGTIFDVQYSQYLKGELEFIKHWILFKKKVFAMRTFVGLAVPFGNSNSIPFSRSYFAGGSNDIRAWQPYSLGPGSSGGIYDFNEANMSTKYWNKLSFLNL